MTIIPVHFDMTLASIVAFGVAFFACVAGIFYSEYRENWLQHFGMILVGIASAFKMFQLWHRHYTSPETAILAIGLALFATGVAWKVWQHRRGWDGNERRAHERRQHHGALS